MNGLIFLFQNTLYDVNEGIPQYLQGLLGVSTVVGRGSLYSKYADMYIKQNYTKHHFSDFYTVGILKVFYFCLKIIIQYHYYLAERSQLTYFLRALLLYNSLLDSLSACHPVTVQAWKAIIESKYPAI